MNQTKTRLERKLSLIKLLSQRNQVSLDELENFTGFTKEELKRELSQLFMAGTYPFTPADLIEVDCNGEFVSLNLPTKIDDIIGLTIYEWLALRSAIEKILTKKIGLEEERILQQVLEKIKKIVPSEIYYNFSYLRSEIFRAMNLSKQVAFYYRSRESISPELRRVDPWEVFDDKTSYLIAYCHTHNGPRFFRLDNIQNLKILDIEIEFKPQEKQIQSQIQAFYQFTQTAKDSSVEVELLIENESFYNFSSTVELQVIDKEYSYKGLSFVRAKTKLIHETWFLDRIRAYEKAVVILKPVELRKKICKEIRECLEQLD